MSDPYRCDKCRKRVNRCAPCRELRAEKKRELRARKRKAGICTECTEPATEGTLCDQHQLGNLMRSKASHALARAEGRE